MALDTDMAFAPEGGVARDGVIRDDLSIEGHLNGVGPGLDLEGIPLTRSLGRDVRRRSETINGASLVQRREVAVGIDVVAHVVDLDLVAFVGGQLPIARGLACIQSGEANEYKQARERLATGLRQRLRDPNRRHGLQRRYQQQLLVAAPDWRRLWSRCVFAHRVQGSESVEYLRDRGQDQLH